MWVGAKLSRASECAASPCLRAQLTSVAMVLHGKIAMLASPYDWPATVMDNLPVQEVTSRSVHDEPATRPKLAPPALRIALVASNCRDRLTTD